MHSWARWAILCVILALSASVALPARAAFGDCHTREYWAQFDERYAAPGSVLDFDCVERLRVPVHTRDGMRHMRLVHHPSADWIADDAAMAAFDRGLRDSARAFERLGGVALDDVTILLADDFPPRVSAERFSDIAALTMFDTSGGECKVIVYLAGPAGLSEHAAWVIAHEIFHCVQSANLSPEQISSGSTGSGGGGDWWIEGSASWFAAMAMPDMATMQGFLERFDELSPTTPLTRMAYEATVFFCWLDGEISPPRIMEFLRGMAPTRAEAQQRAAMLAALPQERWLDFAEAYLDGEIGHPNSGGSLGLRPANGDIWEWSATRTVTLPLEPFTLVRGVVAFQCGHWRTSVRPPASHSARPEDGGAWAALPDEIDTSSGSGGNYRFAAMHAGPSRVTMNIVGTQESGCGDCMGVRTLDACVVGQWQLTGGGPVEWMRAQGVPITSASIENTTLTLRADGTFVTGAVQGRLEMETGRSHGEGQAAAQAGGRWSTSGGVLNLCADMQAFAGRGSITRDGVRRDFTLPSQPAGNSSERYACEGSSLNTERDIPGASPMPFQYTRIGGG